jgi:hypothetical protein
MEVEKGHTEPTEHHDIETNQGNTSSGEDAHEGVAKGQDYIPNEAREGDVVTLKTWTVVIVRCYFPVQRNSCFPGVSLTASQILSCSYGLSFWMVPALAAIQGQIATQLGKPANAAWWTTVYVLFLVLICYKFVAQQKLISRFQIHHVHGRMPAICPSRVYEASLTCYLPRSPSCSSAGTAISLDDGGSSSAAILPCSPATSL